MAGRRAIAIRSVTRTQVPFVNDASTQFAVDKLTGAVNDLESKQNRSSTTFDLVVGVNRVTTNLGRKAQGCTVTPTVADASFGWSFSASGETQALITVVGAPQPKATIEFY